MIQDAEDLDDGATLQADICVVGAGPAGISLALRLMDGGRSVLLLEAGGERTEPEAQALYEGRVTDAALHCPPDKYRQRRFGGTSGTWGGRCVPFDPIDFERRPWIDHSGWPFGLETLLPYYPEANRLCEAGRFAYTVEQAFPQGARAMIAGFRPRRLTDNTLERFSCPTDFGRRYRARMAASDNVRVLLHANVVELRTSGDRIEGLSVRSSKGRNISVHAGQVVLAMGGLEIPRVLLASRDHHAEGVGNGSDWVGRAYMCHIAGTLGEVKLTRQRAVWHGYEVSQEGIYCRRRLALTAAAQAELGAGNFVAHLHHPRIPDPAHRTGALSALYLAKPFISYEYSKRLHGEVAATPADWLAHVRNVALDPFGTAAFLMHWGRKRTLAARKFPSIIVQPRSGTYSLDFNSEQAPNRSSRVRLMAERDRLGLQRLAIDWRYSATDMHTVREGVRVLSEDLATSGCGSLSYDPGSIETHALRDGAYGGHHIGTTRMSASPREGVVDATCRVHGISNLYVASSAVFPTSSQANPTLTIVALALRLADHLQQQAERAPVVTSARAPALAPS